MATEYGCRFCGGRNAVDGVFTIVCEVPTVSDKETAQKPFYNRFAVCGKCREGKPFKNYLKEREAKAQKAWEYFLATHPDEGAGE